MHVDHASDNYLVQCLGSTLTLNSERPPTSCLPFPLLILWSSSVEHLQEVRRSPSHSRMDVGFAGFDVVVEVISERLNVRDVVCSTVTLEMAWE